MRQISLILLALCSALLIFSFHSASEENSKYALIITIDGLRPDAITKDSAPYLTELIKNGSYSANAKTVDPPSTLPSHVSLVTGLKPKKHGTFVNEWIDSMGYTELDTIFTQAKKEGFSTAMFVGKDKLNFIAAPGSIDKLRVIDYSPTSVREITESFRSYIKDNMTGITLIHFPEPDIPGHNEGWMSAEYMEAVSRVDSEIGQIVETLISTEVFDETFIVITADHGGIRKNHKGNDPLVTTIPWLAVGKHIKKNYIITEQVYIYDTAPTVLKALGIKQITGNDGRVLNEIFINK